MKTILTTVAIVFAAAAFAQDSTRIPAVTFSGFTEGYYSYDFNKPADHNKPGFLYNYNRHNEFTVNLAFIRASYAREKVRGMVAFGAGTYMNANYAAEPGTLKNIYEANVGFKLSANNLWFDVGILPSHIGFESAVGKDDQTVTRSLLADNTPFFEGGARLTYTSDNGHWLLSGLLLNGWQRITRIPGNSKMSFGTQIQFRPSSAVTLNYSTFIGSDKPDSASLNRIYHNLYGSFQVAKQLAITAGFDVGTEQKTKGGTNYNTVLSPVLIARYAISSAWAVTLRGEYYSDENGILIPTGTTNGFKTAGYSLNLDYAPLTNVLVRLEARRLESKDDVFLKNNVPTDHDTFITFSTAISF
jgi:hypothetical protein